MTQRRTTLALLQRWAFAIDVALGVGVVAAYLYAAEHHTATVYDHMTRREVREFIAITWAALVMAWACNAVFFWTNLRREYRESVTRQAAVAYVGGTYPVRLFYGTVVACAYTPPLTAVLGPHACWVVLNVYTALRFAWHAAWRRSVAERYTRRRNEDDARLQRATAAD